MSDLVQDNSTAQIQDSAFAKVPPCLKAALTNKGFTSLTAVQSRVLEQDLEDKNLKISSQTGSGKTVAIGIALAEELQQRLETQASKGPHILIITPTRELAGQVRDELNWLYADIPKASCVVVTGGTSVHYEQKQLKRSPALVVGTPGRLLDHITSKSLDCRNLFAVVLDEADQMLDMGFKDELDAIVEALPANRKSHLVSATFPKEVEKLANYFAPDALHIEGTQLGSAHQDITHIAHLVRGRELYPALVNSLLMLDRVKSLVFVRRRIDAAEIAEKLAKDGFSALPLSGDLPQAQRQRTLHAFRHHTIDTLVATDVAARGIDVADIEAVIHIGMPSDADTYIHRSGRTGRAGKKGKSIALVPLNSERKFRETIRQTKVEIDWRSIPSAPSIMKSLKKKFRHNLHEGLAERRSLEEHDANIDYAQFLIEKYEPIDIIAHLVDLAQPKPIREPFLLDAPRQRSSSGVISSRHDYLRFEINWGKKDGASPKRVVAQLCRRGKISSRAIGAIRVEDSTTFFEIQSDKASSFERNAQRRDHRDSNTKIRCLDTSKKRNDDSTREPRQDSHQKKRPPARHHSHKAHRSSHSEKPRRRTRKNKPKSGSGKP